MIRVSTFLLCALAAFSSQAASAHLLHKQNATMKIVDNSANFVVSVPVSALDDVDLDSDGVLSIEELEAGTDRIIAQFNESFEVYDGDVAGQQALTLVTSPETHNPTLPTDYVVVMQRVFFDQKPSSLRISFDLFGETSEEQTLTFQGTEGEDSETAILTAEQNEHTFFAARTAGLSGSPREVAQKLGVQVENWALLGGMVAAAIAVFSLLRFRWSRA